LRIAATKRSASRRFCSRERADRGCPRSKPFLRAMKELPAVRLGVVQHPGDFGVRVLERLAQHEHGTFFRRERVEQHHERERQRLGERRRLLRLPLDQARGRPASEDRLRQPRSDILLARDARRLQPIERESRDDGHQIRARRTQIRRLRS
jgi:hypothetical protein